MTNPTVQFNFLTDDNDSNPITFSQPEKVIVASTTDEVNKCLDEVEQAITDGYYVAGYVSYEATYAFYEGLSHSSMNKMPLLWFGVFRGPSSDTIHKSDDYSISDWKMMESKATYEKNFQLIKDTIQDNKIEQINYTVPFQANFNGNPYAYYTDLKNSQQAKYSAYLNIGDFKVLSVSPELFFHVQNNVIKVKPMKGTIHRGKTYEEDVINKRWLQASSKNRFENKLISDLMKCELKKVADESSIKVTSEFDVEKYPTLYQMTSTITGEVLPGIRMTEIMKALFPCGSISGVPKHETLQMIANIESNPREVYCGAIGYITPNNEAIFNVPIRTVTIEENSGIARYGAGGAITDSSILHDEYEEVLTKTKVLHAKHQPFQLLETFGLYDGEYVVFDEHISRLEKSATYFNFKINIVRLKSLLNEYAKKYADGVWRVRIVVDKVGNEQIDIYELPATTHNIVQLAAQPINRENIFLYHKTTNRSLYDKHIVHNVFDTLLWNENEEITEFTIGNIVLELNDQLVTPPIECGLLPGTFREKLLNERKITEKIIYKSDLVNSTNIWLINSVRKWVKVTLQI